ncbi:MAG: 2-hydroxyacyl-CoA dehydratase [Candidatus Helarchaeota archaeon]|nr:2-hydroxyacyl-CoA dehydratase [Candidatus Helarchaeota archaeon]
MTILDKIKDLNNNRIDELWSMTNKKIIGWICNYTPEEIIHAGGAIPYRIYPGGDEDTPASEADNLFFSRICPFARAILGYKLTGDSLNFLDGIVSAHTCDAIRRLLEIWQIHLNQPTFIYQILLPRNKTKNGVNYFEKELTKFTNSLENFLGVKITNDDISKSIRVFNETRRLLNKFQEKRREIALPINSIDAFEVYRAAMILDKEKVNELLTLLIKEIDNYPKINGRKRILYSGSILAEQDTRIQKTVESAGGMVVFEETCTESRYASDLINEEIESPIAAIAEYQFNKIQCPRMRETDSRSRLKYVLNAIEDYRIDGVIYHTLKFCDNFKYDYPIFKEELNKIGIPILNLETEYGVDAGQLRTRIEAFLEIIGD